MVKIRFIHKDLSFELKAGTELVDECKINPAIPIKFGCRKGGCGTCLVNVVEGIENFSPMTKNEKQTLLNLHRPGDSSYRLACQCGIKGDVVIF